MTKKAVIITAQAYEDEEVIYPAIRLKEAGFEVDIATDGKILVSGRKLYPLETLIKYYANLVDFKTLDSKDYDVVILPGGFEAPDRVRRVPEVLSFVRAMNNSKKIVAAICHGPWILISTGILKGKKATCYPSIKDDLQNAGAEYVQSPVVVDDNIITSPSPRELGDFMRTILGKF